ncbi:MAG TPA: STAS domain-containing protein [Actinomadura sp.]|jgi:anti-anti-sigma factor|nr:STAS domain-containing protein [Actinomadura sp.]
MKSLELSSTERDGCLVVTVRGDLDASARQKLDGYLAEAGRGTSQLVVDLSEVTFLDTAGLAVLTRHWRTLDRTGGSLILAGARYKTARALWITGLAERLPLAEDVEHAIAVTRTDPESPTGS